MEVIGWTLIIFFARVIDVGLDAFRVQFIVRRKAFLAGVIGFVEVLIFILIVSRVISDIQHWTYVVAYAAGFATGTALGTRLSDRLSHRAAQATVISNGPSAQVEDALREAGFAMTRYEGFGRDGRVDVIDVVCGSRQLPQLMKLVKMADPKAFVYVQDLAGLRGGYVFGLRSRV
jgi:uncharacterized protein YebE (UPF0316 family)